MRSDDIAEASPTRTALREEGLETLQPILAGFAEPIKNHPCQHPQDEGADRRLLGSQPAQKIACLLQAVARGLHALLKPLACGTEGRSAHERRWIRQPPSHGATQLRQPLFDDLAVAVAAEPQDEVHAGQPSQSRLILQTSTPFTIKALASRVSREKAGAGAACSAERPLATASTIQREASSEGSAMQAPAKLAKASPKPGRRKRKQHKTTRPTSHGPTAHDRFRACRRTRANGWPRPIERSDSSAAVPVRSTATGRALSYTHCIFYPALYCRILGGGRQKAKGIL